VRGAALAEACHHYAHKGLAVSAVRGRHPLPKGLYLRGHGVEKYPITIKNDQIDWLHRVFQF
jgi:hypothetical protein